ncbi:MAG: crossover junction endodeoxyribonuclease RuvC [Actinomycetota bacterium]
MFEGCVLGVDPGLGTAGLAAVDARGGATTLTWSSTVRTPRNLPQAARLRLLHDAVGTAIAEHRPVAVAVERLMWGRNTTSAFAVARASGVVLLAASQAGLPVEEYAPLEVKMAITGAGDASKEQVRSALERLHGLGPVPRQADAGDAVAVALCHCLQATMRSAAARAGVR